MRPDFDETGLFLWLLFGMVRYLAKRCEKKSTDKNSHLEIEDTPESYRVGMLVEEVMVFETWFGKSGYYICPRCKITMDREFISFCDRCGQKLDWKNYRKAKIVYPGKARK